MYTKKFVSIKAVNIEAITPKDNVMEKPLIGPEPKANSKTAAIRVVILASSIVDIALSKPFFTI